MKNIRNNKGITLIILILYIIVTIIVIGMLTTLSVYFRDNLNKMDVGTVQDVEFDKINLQFLKETKNETNKIDMENSDSTTIVFTNGKVYMYNSTDKAIYLDDNILIADKIEECTFNYVDNNGKQKLITSIKINNITRITEYVLSNTENTTTTL